MKKLIYSQEDIDLILSIEMQEKDEEIERLNNIINELEKWLTDDENSKIYYNYENKYEYIYVDDLLDKLKELKEGK